MKQKRGNSTSDPLVSDFTRRLWRDYLKSNPRLSQTLASGEVVAGGDGQVMNMCKCDRPCGAVKCAPGMVYEWPEVWPELPE